MIALRPLTARVDALRRDRSGLAFVEFALTLPLFLMLALGGAELTNYITTRMRVSQLALHIADNAARIGSGSQLQAKTISELDINDLLTGAGFQAGELDLYGRGRVILSSLEEDPGNPGKYRIRWQRCRGSKSFHKSSFGKAGDTGLAGMGPVGRQVTAPEDGATMFVEVYYEYEPLIRSSLAPGTTMIETASMMVRDRRDLTKIYNIEGVAKASC